MEKNRTIITLTRIALALLLVLIVVLYLLATVFLFGSDRKEVIRCSQYKTQPEAQEVFISDRIKYAALDANKDGIACNDSPKQ